MKTAVRALGYPKPHMKKLTCKGLGAADTSGRYVSFRCVATYAPNRHRRFYAAGRGEGGWLCESGTLAGCTNAPRHGFVATAALNADGSKSAAADVAARGYLSDRDQTPYQPVHFCQQTGAVTWSCPFMVNNSPVTVTISFKAAKGGAVITGTTS